MSAMSLKLTRSVALASFTALAALVAGQASAAVLTQASDEYVGLVNDGVPSNPANEVIYINDLKDLAPGALDTACGTETCNRIGSTLDTTGLDDAVVTGAIKNESGDFDGIDVTGWTWLLGKYDAENAGSLVWYVGDLNELVDIPSTFNGHGLSHYSLYNPGTTTVPEPATLLLVGLGLVGLGLARRRRQV